MIQIVISLILILSPYSLICSEYQPSETLPIIGLDKNKENPVSITLEKNQDLNSLGRITVNNFCNQRPFEKTKSKYAQKSYDKYARSNPDGSIILLQQHNTSSINDLTMHYIFYDNQQNTIFIMNPSKDFVKTGSFGLTNDGIYYLSYGYRNCDEPCINLCFKNLNDTKTQTIFNLSTCDITKDVALNTYNEEDSKEIFINTTSNDDGSTIALSTQNRIVILKKDAETHTYFASWLKNDTVDCLSTDLLSSSYMNFQHIINELLTHIYAVTLNHSGTVLAVIPVTHDPHGGLDKDFLFEPIVVINLQDNRPQPLLCDDQHKTFFCKDVYKKQADSNYCAVSFSPDDRMVTVLFNGKTIEVANPFFTRPAPLVQPLLLPGPSPTDQNSSETSTTEKATPSKANGSSSLKTDNSTPKSTTQPVASSDTTTKRDHIKTPQKNLILQCLLRYKKPLCALIALILLYQYADSLCPFALPLPF